MVKEFRQRALRDAERDPDSTKSKILSAAEDLFARHGFAGTTTRDIAEAAGVNVASIHYHWGTKEELWNAVHYNLLHQAISFAGKVALSVAGSESREGVRVIISKLFDFLADNPNAALLMTKPVPEGINIPWPGESELPDYGAVLDYMDKLTDLDFDPVEPHMAFFFILGVMLIFFLRRDLIVTVFNEDPDNMSPEFRRRVVDSILVLVERFGQVSQ